MFPSVSLLTQPEEVRDELFCDEDNIPERCIGENLCHCIHRLRVKKGAIVELTVVDETASEFQNFN